MSAARARWTRVEPPGAGGGPAARSGHAMTLLAPTASVLLFGGADGRVFFDDFHVLEPARYADEAGDARLRWRRLAVTHAPARHALPCVDESQLSTGSSPGRRRGSHVEPPHAGSGRDYHTMHYVAESEAEERARGMRVLVVGNVVIAAGAANALAFEMSELRVEEARVRQPTLEAQWVPRRVDSMWKPRARHAHSSALINGQQLFVFGGKTATSSAYFNDLFYFDTVLNQWRRPPVAGSAPAARAFASLAASDAHDKLFLYGGTDGKETFGSLFIFDVALSRWDALAGGGVSGDRPSCRVGHSLTFASPHHLVVFGGRQRAKRQNQLFVFNMEKREWRRVSGSTDSNSTSTDNHNDAEELPVGRTAHAAVLYDSASSQASIDGEETHSRLIIFGGYAGSHRWLDDLYIVSLPTPTAPAQSQRHLETQQSQSQQQDKRPTHDSSESTSTYLDATTSEEQPEQQRVAQAAPATVLHTLFAHQTQRPQAPPTHHESDPNRIARPQSHSQPSNRSSLSSSSLRCESQSSNHSSGGAASGGVLSDITNQAPSSPRVPVNQSGVSKPPTTGSMSSSLSSISTSPFKSNKRRRVDEGPQELENNSSSSSSDSTRVSIGLQTALLQVLQHQSTLEQGIVRIESMLDKRPNPSPDLEVSTGISNRSTSQCCSSASPCIDTFVRQQNESLESQLDLLRRKYDALEEVLRRSEQEKADLREQLVARETELYVARRGLERVLPPLGERVQAVENASRAHLAAAQMIESKISAVHDILDELRHANGEGTEAEESPDKHGRIASSPGSNSSLPTSTPPLLYPRRIVQALEHRLQAAQMERDNLQEQLQEARAKLARAEEKEQHTRKFFSAWFDQDAPAASTPSATQESRSR